MKILAKAMIKQIDRVCSDLCGQPAHFRARNPHALSVGIVGVNQADHYVSYESDRAFPTGRYGPHPFQEAAEAVRRLRADASPCFDEFLIIPFRATNEAPFDFDWIDPARLRDEYAAMLVRLLNRYARR